MSRNFVSLISSLALPVALAVSPVIAQPTTQATVLPAPGPFPAPVMNMPPPPPPRFMPPPPHQMRIMPPPPPPMVFPSPPPRFGAIPGKNFNMDLFRQSIAAERESAGSPAHPSRPAAQINTRQKVRLEAMLSDQRAKYESVNQRYEALKKQHEEQRAMLQEAQQKAMLLPDLRQRLSLVEQERDVQKLQSAELQTQVDSGGAKLSDLGIALASAEATQSALTEFQQRAIKDLDSLTQEVTDRDRQLETLRSQLAELQATASSHTLELQSSITEKGSALESAQMRIAELEKQIETSQDTVQQQSAAADTNIARLTSDLTTAQAAQSSLSSFQQRAIKEMDELAEKNAARDKDLEALRGQVSDYQTKLEQLQTAASAHGSDLQTSLGEKSSALESAQLRIAELEKRTAEAEGSAQQQTIAANDELTLLRETVANRDNQILTLNEQFTGSQSQLGELQATVDAGNTRIAELEPGLTRIPELELQLGAAQETLAARDNEIQTLKDQLSGGQSQFGELQAAFDASRARIGELEPGLARIPELEQQLGGAQEALTVRDNEIQALKDQLTDGQSRFGELQAAFDASKTRIGELEPGLARIPELEQQLGGAQEALTARDNEIQALKNSLAGGLSQFDELQAAFNAGKSRISALEPLQAKTSELEASLSENEQALADSRKQAEGIKAENQKLAEQLAAAQADGKDAQAKLDQSTQNCKKLDDELATLRSKLDGNLGMLKSQEEMLAQIKGDYASLRQERDKLKLSTTDTDNDGVSDAEDKCPDSGKGATVGADGCEPDSDKDGLANVRDLCPDTPEGEAIDAMGCHPKATIALEGVNFQIGTARLTPESSAILDRVVSILKKFQDLQLEVAGHTDNTGSKGINTRLSAARAESVRAYLIENGIAEERIAAKGYGPDEPIASNETSEGRKANRRVELRRR